MGESGAMERRERVATMIESYFVTSARSARILHRFQWSPPLQSPVSRLQP